MPEYTVTSPDGSEYEVTAPEGGTKEQAIQYVQGEVAAGRLKPKVKAKGPVSVPPLKTIGPLDQALQESRADASELTTKLRPNVDRAALESLNALDVPFRAAGNAVMEATGSPAAATAAYALPQFIGPASVVKIVERAVKLGKVSREAAPSFAEVLKKRLAKEGVTGLPKGKLDDLTPEQVDKIIEAMGKTPLGQPGKPIKSVEQKAGAKAKESVTPEDITGDPNAGNLDDVPAFNERPEPKLGAEPAIIDPAPEPKPAGTKPVKPMRDEGGKINPALVTKLASTTTGALVGAGLDPDNPWHGAILGAAGGYGLGHIVSRRVISGGFGSALKAADNPGKLLHDAKEAEIAAAQRGATQTFEQLKSFKIPPERGLLVIRAIETGDVSALLPQEKAVAQLFSQEVGRLGMAAQEAGVIQNLKKNYAPLIFDWNDPHTAATLRKMGAADPSKGERTAGFSTFTPFQLERTIDDYGMALRLGLKPKTTDPAELFRLYASSVVRATENKRAITELANLKDPTGRPVVGLQGTVPKDFVPINKGDVKVPELDGFLVDPDIADSVRAGLTSYDPNIIARSAMNVSWFAKRFNVSLSAFHPMALLQAHAGAGGNPFDVLAGAAARGAEKVSGKTVPYESSVDRALKAYRDGGAGDAVDTLIRNGLKIEAPIEDRSGRDAFQSTMKLVGDKANSLVPGGDLVPKGAALVDKGLQSFTWDYMYTGMKLSTGMKMLEQEVQRNMKAAAAGKEALKPVNEIAADVSSFVNSTFGGLNLRRIAEDVEKQWGGKAGGAAYSIASPRGQAYLQMAVFAPDWKISTLQAWTRGLGLTGNETVQRFHREYLVRSAMMSMVLADAVNYKLSGHHVWQNDFHTKRGHQQTAMERVHDATYVDLGDGRKMQMFKHLMEGPHAVSDPQKFALNALGYLPSTVAEGLTNKEFLTPDWSPNITSGHEPWLEKVYKHGMHALKRAMPIAGHQFDAGIGPTLGGFAGVPIYGMTAEQKAKLSRQRMEEKAKAMQNR